ncbi:MAG: glutamyl-tRNA reductase [Deltaproteobacteria bacterium]|nr:MAG: glutamyl-tRNA reductase [Deltaproteobacteria bacterium]
MSHKLLLLGTSHRTAPVEAREQLAVPEGDVPALLDGLVGQSAIREAVLLSTCNRVELVVAGEEEEAMRASLLQHLERERGISLGWVERYAYALEGEEAIRHLFRVASSLDSLIVGEPQIIGQVKAAWRVAQESGATAATLNRLFNHALRTAKRVRTETRIAENAVSISYAAVELAKKVFGRLDGKRILVIGAGKMGRLAARHLIEAGARDVDILNRSEERARGTAAEIGGQAFPLSSLGERLVHADIVISSTGSQSWVVTPELLGPAMERRRFRPLFLIDIAVPRDIDPRCADLNNAYVFDVDDLDRVVQDNLKQREYEANRAGTIIDDEVGALQRWMAQHEVVPTIVCLREKLTRLKDAELDRMKRTNPGLPPEAVDAATRMAHGLINKILHEPTLSLRQAGGVDQGEQLVSAVRDLFNLDDEPDGDGNELPPQSKQELH